MCRLRGLPSLATGMVGSGVVVGGLVGGLVGTGTTRTHNEINTHNHRQKRKKDDDASVWIIEFKPAAVEDLF